VSKKGKLEKFAQVASFGNVIQPSFEEVFKNNFKLKGKWSSEFFGNNNKITLELGCGKGEYTLGLAREYPNKNFIGIDIKGARIWKGAKEAIEKEIHNVAFIRTRIDFINSFFDKDEVDEIWITFPDPQPKKILKRLTSSRFLNYYNQFLVEDSCINLKTDSVDLFKYTKSLAEYNKLTVEKAIDDIYKSKYRDDKILSIKTFYEKGWLKDGLHSQYIRFRLKNGKKIEEPPEE
jgi:tRNA (guanine-N7-)-methyltransferase